MKFPTKKLVLILTLLFLTISFPGVVLGAATNTGGAWFAQPTDRYEAIIKNAAETGQTSVEPYVLSIMTNMAHGVILALGGMKTTTQTPQGAVQTYEGGAIGALTDLTGSLYVTPPASSVEYIADLGSNLGVLRPAYAQGLGFQAFTPLLDFWKKIRDAAYLAYVLIFIIIGFMVMFRKRIDPRTVVTVQEALPKIVVTLILITFSYAIVGLFIDFMQLVNFLLIKIFFGDLIPTLDVSQFLSHNVFDLLGPFYSLIGDAGDAAGAALSNVPLAGGLVNITVRLIFTVALTFTMFRIFFMLLGSYIGIILSVIFAPFQILMAALPGQESSPFAWIKSLMANIVVFPATLAMLIISFRFILTGAFANPTAFTNTPWGLIRSGMTATMGTTGQLNWSPPLLGFGGNLGVIIGFGILLAIPALGDTVKEMFKTKPSPLTGAAEQAIRGGLSWVPIIGGMAR